MALSYRYLNAAPALRVAPAPAIEGVISGYLALWGSPENRDAYGTWFDKGAPPDLGLNDGEYLPIRMMYEHGGDPSVGLDIIGSVTRIWPDDNGIAFEGTLDRASPYFETVINEIGKGVLKTSSASSPHLAKFDEAQRFVNWYLTEVSLTANPAEPRMTPVQVIRAKGQPGVDSTDSGAQSEAKPTKRKTKMTLTLSQLGLTPESSLEDVMSALTEALGPDAAKAFMAAQIGGSAEAPDATDQPETELSASPDERTAPVAPAATPAAPSPVADAAPRSAPAADIAALNAQIAALRAEVGRQRTAPPVAQPAPATRARVSVGEDLRYAHLSPDAMALGYLIMRSRRDTPSESYVRNLGGKWADRVNRAAAGDAVIADPAVRSYLPVIRAGEVATSTASGGGDEWVGVMYASGLWETVRHNLIFEQLVSKGMRQVEVPQGMESVYVSTEGADPTVYTIAQDPDLAASGRPDVNVQVTRIGTGRVLLTPGELGLAVAWTDTFDEDSINAVASQYQYQIQQKAQETIEQLFLNGDTETGASTNINLIDGTPGTGLSTPYYIASNGALKYPLVTATSYSRDAGSLDENDYRLTLKLLPSAIRTRYQNLAFVIDPDTHSASLDIPAIKTEDVKRTAATIVSGVMTNIWGVDVLTSGMMPLANSAGKVPNAGGTLGRILAVHAPYWAMGWKRRIRIETDRDILSGANLIVAKMRLGFAARGAGASAVSYNVTV